jgi:DNA-binding MarR family transcriptional regulator
MRRMKVDEHVRAIQRWYPQIYLACHTRHQRSASTGVQLSGHDSSVLAHLDEREPMTASALARHLSIGPSTLSATLNRLTKLGYMTRTQRAEDRRTLELRLTAAGARAMQASSVLDSSRVAAVLAALSSDERRRALDGLELLANAARRMSAQGTVSNRSEQTTRSRSNGASQRAARPTTAHATRPTTAHATQSAIRSARQSATPLTTRSVVHAADDAARSAAQRSARSRNRSTAQSTAKKAR